MLRKAGQRVFVRYLGSGSPVLAATVECDERREVDYTVVRFDDTPQHTTTVYRGTLCDAPTDTGLLAEVWRVDPAAQLSVDKAQFHAEYRHYASNGNLVAVWNLAEPRTNLFMYLTADMQAGMGDGDEQ